MPNEKLLAPVSGDDPCGPDLRWNHEFIELMDGLAAAVSKGEGSVLDAEVAQSVAASFEEIVHKAAELSAKTKDVRVLAVHAEASWRDGGLAAFAAAMEDLAVVVEIWPGPMDGIHPRADASDGDLGERGAALRRLLNRIPSLTATIGWGGDVDNRQKAESSAMLRGVFGRWRERLEPVFGADLPSPADAWRSLQGIAVESAVSGGPLSEAAAAASDDGVAPVAVDVWDLIDRAVEQMSRHNRHSPALPILRLLSSWRSLDIVEIADSMKASGVALEQLLESIKKQMHQAS